MADDQLWAEIIKKAEKDSWYFLKYIACTFDEHDPSTLTKPFPEKAMYRLICRAWRDYNILFIEKSRQIMMTWIMAALFLHDSMTQNVRRIFFQSKEQTSANALLDRAKHIYETALNLGIPWVPEAKWTGYKLGTADTLEFPSKKSLIWAIPQGPDIVRSYTCSGILADEMNHQVEFAEGYAAAAPTMAGGGKYVAQGTPNGKNVCWMKLYGIDSRTLEPIGDNLLDSDKIKPTLFRLPEGMDTEGQRHWVDHFILAMSDEEFSSVPFVELVAMMPGMRYWRTAAGVDCLRVHYSADPDKSPDTAYGRMWIARSRQEMNDELKWEREMEIRYDSFDGRPVLPSFNRQNNVRTVEFDSAYPIELSMDFGETCGCLFSQTIPIKGHNAKQKRYLDEIFLERADTVRLGEMVVQKLESRFYRAWQNNNVVVHCDPAGNQGRETSTDKSMNTSIKILGAYGIYPRSKHFGVPESTQFVQTVFARVLPNGEPAVLVDPKCEHLISACAGGWHFPEGNKGRAGFPEKDGTHDHVGDMLRYGICNTFTEFDVTDKRHTYYQPDYMRRRFTGEIVGVRRSKRINPRSRGEHHFVR